MIEKIQKSGAPVLDYQVMLVSCEQEKHFAFGETSTGDAHFQAWRTSTQKYAIPTNWPSGDCINVKELAGVEHHVFDTTIAISQAAAEEDALKIAKEWEELYYLAHDRVRFKVLCFQRNLAAKSFIHFTPFGANYKKEIYENFERHLLKMVSTEKPFSEVNWGVKTTDEANHTTHTDSPFDHMTHFAIQGCGNKAQRALKVYKEWWHENANRLLPQAKNKHIESYNDNFDWKRFDFNQFEKSVVVGDEYQKQEKALFGIAGQKAFNHKPRI